MERFVLLPFTAGCISESSIAVGLQQAKRSKMDTGSTPTSKTPFHRPTFNPPSSYTVCVYLSRVLTPCFDHEGEKDEDEEQYEEDEESLSGENLKSPPTYWRFQDSRSCSRISRTFLNHLVSDQPNNFKIKHQVKNTTDAY